MAGALEHSSQDYLAIQGIFSETGVLCQKIESALQEYGLALNQF